MSAVEVHNCVHCGTETEPSWRFCRRCGTALENLTAEPAAASCGTCATPLAAEWRYCANCGTAAGDSSPATPVVATPAESVEVPATAPWDTPATPVTPDVAEPGYDTAPEAAPDMFDSAPPSAHTEVAEDPIPASQPSGFSGDDVYGDDVFGDDISGDDVSSDDVPDGIPLRDRIQAAERTSESEVPVTDSWDAPTGNPQDDTFAEPVPFPADDPIFGDTPPPERPRPWESPAHLESPAEEPPSLWDRVQAERAAASHHELDSVEPVDHSISSPHVSFDPAAVDLDELTTAEDPPPPSPDWADAPSGPPETDQPLVDFAEETTQPPSAGDVVTIPPTESSPIRRSLPQPIGAPRSPGRVELPKPIEAHQAPPRGSAVDSTPAQQAHDLDLPPLEGQVFQNPGIFGQAVQLALLAGSAVSVAMVVALTVLNNRLNDYATTGESIARVESAENVINTWLRPALAIVLLGGLIALVMWAKRAYANVAAMDREVSEAAPWMWFIPIVNLFVLARHMDLAWKGADVFTRDDPDWRRGRPDWWTVGFLVLSLTAVGGIIYGWLQGADSFETAMDANAISLIGYGLLSGALLMAVKAISNIIARQRTRASQFD